MGKYCSLHVLHALESYSTTAKDNTVRVTKNLNEKDECLFPMGDTRCHEKGIYLCTYYV